MSTVEGSQCSQLPATNSSVIFKLWCSVGVKFKSYRLSRFQIQLFNLYNMEWNFHCLDKEQMQCFEGLVHLWLGPKLEYAFTLKYIIYALHLNAFHRERERFQEDFDS